MGGSVGECDVYGGTIIQHLGLARVCMHVLVLVSVTFVSYFIPHKVVFMLATRFWCVME